MKHYSHRNQRPALAKEWQLLSQKPTQLLKAGQARPIRRYTKGPSATGLHHCHKGSCGRRVRPYSPGRALCPECGRPRRKHAARAAAHVLLEDHEKSVRCGCESANTGSDDGETTMFRPTRLVMRKAHGRTDRMCKYNGSNLDPAQMNEKASIGTVLTGWSTHQR